MKWKERAKSLGVFVLKNLDALFVVIVAAGVLALEALGNPTHELVDSAILALLGVTAIVLLRDRIQTGQSDLSDLRRLAGDAISDRPYEVVWQTKEWDLKDRENTAIKLTERLRFTRNDVATIAHWSSGDGEDTRNVAKWRRSEGTPWIDAKKIYEFPVRGGEKVIYCFDEEHSRGDMLDWCIERDAVRRFRTAHESVTTRARTKSDHPRVMRITWPADSPPSHVEIRFEGSPARSLSPRDKDGRAYVEEKIVGLDVGEAVELAWTW